MTRRLRRECPWDREQDERSIVPHTIEEAYELADAAHAGDDAKLLDELGDVLFQVYFLSLLLEERGQGDLGRVARGTTAKLVRRHPHVFGADVGALEELPTQARTASEVRENWDAIKQTESSSEEPFGNLPENLPALMYARKLLRRVARTEPSAWEALASIARAVGDAERTIAEKEADRDALYDHIGELLFACVELSATVEVDPEVALRRCSERLRQRAGGRA